MGARVVGNQAASYYPQKHTEHLAQHRAGHRTCLSSTYSERTPT